MLGATHPVGDRRSQLRLERRVTVDPGMQNAAEQVVGNDQHFAGSHPGLGAQQSLKPRWIEKFST